MRIDNEFGPIVQNMVFQNLDNEAIRNFKVSKLDIVALISTPRLLFCFQFESEAHISDKIVPGLSNFQDQNLNSKPAFKFFLHEFTR